MKDIIDTIYFLQGTFYSGYSQKKSFISWTLSCSLFISRRLLNFRNWFVWGECQFYNTRVCNRVQDFGLKNLKKLLGDQVFQHCSSKERCTSSEVSDSGQGITLRLDNSSWLVWATPVRSWAVLWHRTIKPGFLWISVSCFSPSCAVQ